MPYTRPGVYVSETPFSTNVSVRQPGTAVAFLGTSPRGPVTPTLIDNWPAYKSIFGDLDQDYDLGYAVYQFFANGGRTAYVNRVVGASATAATGTVQYRPTGDGASTAFTISAASPGTWGDNLSVSITSGLVTATSSVIPTFTMTVSLSNVEVERWSELSLDRSSNRYVASVINNYSKYLTVSNVVTPVADSGMNYVVGTVTLSGGVAGAVVGDSDYVTALANLDEVEGDLIINVAGQYSSTVVAGALNYASNRGNGFVIIDPSPQATTVADIQAVLATYPSSGAGYGAVYYPMLEMYDPAKSGPAAIRTTFPGGAVAGVFIRLENERTVAKAPAGYTVDVRNALGVTTKFTDTQVGDLYSSNAFPAVNTFRVTPGAGVTINGARTLERLRPDLFIPVRRSLNYVKTSARDITQFAVFEPNNSRLWDMIKVRLNRFLTDFWQAGGLKGKTAAEAFYVICDETNNTLNTISDGEVHIQIGVALQYPAEFVVINVSQWTGGSTLSDNL